MKYKLIIFVVAFISFAFSAFAQSDIITTIAGNGTHGFAGDSGAATSALLYYPCKVLYDKIDHGLYVIDGGNYRIRKIDTFGIITTICGDGTPLDNGDGGPATNAELLNPVRMSFDTAGNLFVGCAARLREISTSGMISSIDSGYPAAGIIFDSLYNKYILHYDSGLIYKITTTGIKTKIAGYGTAGYSGDGGPATNAQMNQPYAMTFDDTSNILIADMNNNRIRKINRMNIISTFAGNGTGGDGGLAFDAGLNDPIDVVCDNFGNTYISEHYAHRIRKVNSSGIISTIAGTGVSGYSGDGGTATSAQLSFPNGICLDPCGNLYIADHGNSAIRKVTIPPPTPTVTIASLPSDTLCAELAANIHATVLATGTNTYQWYVNGSVVSATSSALSYLAANGDSVRCVVTNISPCTGTHVISSNTIHLVVDSTSIPTIALSGAMYAATGSTVTVNASVAGAGSSYQIKWRNRGVWFATTTVPIVTYTKTNPIDTITAWVVHTGTGCYDSTLSGVHVVIDSTLGIFSSNSTASFTLYPNPATNELSIKAQEDIRQITITNLLGKTVLSATGYSNEKNLQLAGLPAGVYFVTVNGIWRSKFVKE